MDDNYKKRELDHFFGDVRKDIKEIKVQVTAINGKVKMITKVGLVLGAVVGTLLITNGSEVIHLFMAII